MPFSDLLADAVTRHATDIHLAAGHPPLVRIDGALHAISARPLTAKAVETAIREAIGEAGWTRFAKEGDLDTAYEHRGQRLRVNVHMERGLPAMAARIVPVDIPSFDDIDLPESIRPLVDAPDGLVLVTGPAGSGKSTTLASILQAINVKRAAHIVTLEDPIEYTFPEGKGLVKQRDVGTDTASFAEGLRRALRQDPDVIMVGEMRDPETIAAALTLAETGHLVLSTLHTSSAAQAVTRIVDSFEGSQQDQARHQLSMSLRVVVAQRLLPRKKGGLVAAHEVLFNTSAVANLIRENRVEQIASVIQTGRSDGMSTMEHAIEQLRKDGIVEDAVAAPFLPSRRR